MNTAILIPLLTRIKKLLNEKKDLISPREFEKLTHFLDTVTIEIKNSLCYVSLEREIQLRNILNFLENLKEV